MRNLLFIGADESLEFKNRAAMFLYIARLRLQAYIALTVVESGKVIVFNPFLTTHTKIEYLQNETEALNYVGTFLT